jgi:RHH-type transcriptional regulator, rel operon repressor / antitoxin RelB
MTTKAKTPKTATRAVLSVHAKPETREKLDALARATNKTRSALVHEALEQYLAHQEWLTAEIKKGVSSADRGELVSDSTVAEWFSTIHAK